MNHKSLKSNFLIFLITLLFLILGSLVPAFAQSPKHYTDLIFPSLGEIKNPPYRRYVLNNGLIVYLVENHELPIVNGFAMIKTGDRFEPSDKIGLAGIVGLVMRTGGSKNYSGEQLNQWLEQRAAGIETSIGTTIASANFANLSSDLPEVISRWGDIIRNPMFDQKQIELTKRRIKGQIERRNDDPSNIVSREMVKLIYGPDSPYGRVEEYETIDKITRGDLIEFHKKYFYPNRTILGIVGDFDPNQVKLLIEKAFGDWKPTNESLPSLEPVSQYKKGGLYFVDQPQLNQSYVQMGHLGGILNNPDYPALSVINGILNGFGGRLFNNIRTRQGLAYTVYGTWSSQFDFPGTFISGGQTKSETTIAFIQSIQEQIKRLQSEPITKEELTKAQESVLNSFVFNFQDPGQTLSRLMRYEYYGYPLDFIFQYQKALSKVTIADVQRVAKTYLKPDQMVTLVVGNKSLIQPPLTTLNSTINNIDISIPKG